MWQDTAIAITQAVLTISLIPAVFDTKKPPILTSVPTAIGCAVFAATFATLGFWFSVATSGSACLLWGVLALQRSRQKLPQEKAENGQE